LIHGYSPEVRCNRFKIIIKAESQVSIVLSILKFCFLIKKKGINSKIEAIVNDGATD